MNYEIYKANRIKKGVFMDTVIMVITTWVLIFILIVLGCFCFVSDIAFKQSNDYSDCEIIAHGYPSIYTTDCYGINRVKIGDTDISNLRISTPVGNSWQYVNKSKLCQDKQFIVYKKFLLHGDVYAIKEVE